MEDSEPKKLFDIIEPDDELNDKPISLEGRAYPDCGCGHPVNMPVQPPIAADDAPITLIGEDNCASCGSSIFYDHISLEDYKSMSNANKLAYLKKHAYENRWSKSIYHNFFKLINEHLPPEKYNNGYRLPSISDPNHLFDESLVVEYKHLGFDYQYIVETFKLSIEFISKMTDKITKQQLFDSGHYDIKDRTNIMKAYKDLK